MIGPCLCGDTACGRCHPEGQASMTCPECGWRGKLCDAGFISDEDEAFDKYGGCPDCGGDLVSLEEDVDDTPPDEPDGEDAAFDERVTSSDED